MCSLFPFHRGHTIREQEKKTVLPLSSLLLLILCHPIDLLASTSSKERLGGREGDVMVCPPLGQLQFSPCMHAHLPSLTLKVNLLSVHVHGRFTYPENYLSPWPYLGSWILVSLFCSLKTPLAQN